MKNNHSFIVIPLLAALALAGCSAPAPSAQTSSTTNAESTAQTADANTQAITLQSGQYQIDPTHTIVLAQWNHLGFSNPSMNFADAEGVITINADDMSQSSVQVRFPLSSAIVSFSKDFDGHLRGADFFDVANFPQAQFVSTAVKPAGVNRYTVSGNLTIKDNTHPVELAVTLNGSAMHPMKQKQTIGFDATAQVLRSQFGLGMHTPNVSDEVQLRITSEAVLVDANAQNMQ